MFGLVFLCGGTRVSRGVGMLWAVGVVSYLCMLLGVYFRIVVRVRCAGGVGGLVA